MSDVVVIGGGIVGCACAYELARAGAKVTLLEYGKTGMQATNAAAGMLAPMIEAQSPGPMLRLGVRALREYPALVAELETQCGFDLEFRADGVLRLAFERDELEMLQVRHAWQRQMGLPLEWLDRDACVALEPKLSPRALGGIFSPTEAGISSQLLTLALERAAKAGGAVIRERSPVMGFVVASERVSGVRTPEAVFACDFAVLAAGARSGQIAHMLPRFDRRQAAGRASALVPVRPVRGQMIALGGMSTPIRHIVWGPRGYLVPRANGLIFAGATVEEVGFRRRATKAGVRGLLAMSKRLVPQLSAAVLHFEWAGLRPGTPDGLPIIGPLPGQQNVIAATGHFRSGILLGPLTGKLVARGIIEGDWSEVPEEFSPARFA